MAVWWLSVQTRTYSLNGVPRQIMTDRCAANNMGGNSGGDGWEVCVSWLTFVFAAFAPQMTVRVYVSPKTW